MNYFTYKMIHLISLTLMFVSFGFMLVAVAIGGAGAEIQKIQLCSARSFLAGAFCQRLWAGGDSGDGGEFSQLGPG
ncbi:hypothetical protein ACES2J_04605 [Bdellovibrio bacteriovorus]|uniref:hypothetical protein n=1 Tax=Bdellovibrio bacteriovorus TaxID=959 RepID=UPI0035A69E33